MDCFRCISVGTFYIEYFLKQFHDDTLINQKRYTKIFSRFEDETIYAGAFRNDTSGKVYFVPPVEDYVEEHLWYDFSLNVGDTAFDVALNDMWPGIEGLYDLYVDSVTYINVGPYYLKCILLIPIEPDPLHYNGNYLVWIEKIGSLIGGIYNMYLCGLNWQT